MSDPGMLNWMSCPEIETVPGKMSGVAVLRHSRVRPGDLIVNMDEDAEWMAENFGLPLGQVLAVLAFYAQQSDQLARSA